MVRVVSYVCITIFWMITTFIFIKKDILPVYLILQDPPSYETMLKNIFKDEHSLFGIYIAERKIGVTETIIKRLPEDGYLFINQTKIDKLLVITFLEGIKNVDKDFLIYIYSQISFDRNYKIKSLYMNAKVPGMKELFISGEVKGNKIVLISDKGYSREISIDRFNIITSGLYPVFSMPKLIVGKKWNILWLQPHFSSNLIDFEEKKVRAEVEKEDVIKINGKWIECFRIFIETSPFPCTAWISKDGKLLKEKASIFTFIREDD